MVRHASLAMWSIILYMNSMGEKNKYDEITGCLSSILDAFRIIFRGSQKFLFIRYGFGK